MASIPSGFTVSNSTPIDSRFVCKTLTDRDAILQSVRYKGLVTYVESEDKYYYLKGGLLNSNWFEIPINNGGGTTSNPVYTTSQAVSEFDIVGLDSSGKIYPIDANDISHSDTLVGISLETKNSGEQCQVKVFGEISNPAWILSVGKTYYCGLNGKLTSNPSSYQWMQRVGKAIDMSTIIINIGDCILVQ